MPTTPTDPIIEALVQAEENATKAYSAENPLARESALQSIRCFLRLVLDTFHIFPAKSNVWREDVRMVVVHVRDLIENVMFSGLKEKLEWHPREILDVIRDARIAFEGVIATLCQKNVIPVVA